MSVIVENLTKIYGTQKAVNDISFEAKKGEVLGFLGPNGAGKTTTMKILTSYIPQTSGKATVCGYDTSEDPMAVRKNIGYLPEHNPLYKEMYVKEYLTFVAGLHKVGNKKSRVAQMIEKTGLDREQNKLIGELSKGYRQRVGLAQAMLHNPDVLILDEPTTGLDPNQIVEIRNLIKELGQEKTVIFSTHIMQEVQLICDRVLIINKGEMVVNDSIDTLQNHVKNETIITVEFLEPVYKNKLETIAYVREARSISDQKWQLVAEGNNDIRPAIFKYAVANNLTLVEMHKEVISVENIFQTLTK